MSLSFISNLIVIMIYSETYYHLRPLKSLENENITCYSCHTSLVLDKKNFLPVILERESVHYKNGKYCTDCHKEEDLLLKKRGGVRDKIYSSCPAYKKAFKDRHKINEMCGGCHKNQLEDLLSGVHKNKLDCVYCHSNHGIKKASLDIINPDRCSSCHRYPDVAPVKDEFRKAETVILATESFLKRYQTDMPEIYERYTREINLSRENMKSQHHKLLKADISSYSNHILLLSGHIRKELTAELERRKVKRLITSGVGIIIFLAIMGILYYLYQYYKWRRTLNKK